MLVASACAFGPLSPNLGHNKHKHARRIRISNVALFSSSDEDLLSGGSSSSSSPSSSSSSSASSSRTNSAFSQNEFSRILHVDRIFQHRRRSAQTGTNHQRDHQVSVKADAEECKALAKRFDLKGLTRLEAELSFRPATEAMATASGAGGKLPVEAEGTIEAHLTQTCVRTNEEFEIDVEFPIYAVVKPVTSNNDEDLRRLFLQEQEEEAAAEASGKKKKKKNINTKKQPKDDVFHENKKVHNLSDIFDLQAAIQEADIFGDDEGGAADLVEDEAIYSLSSEQLDVGELIAQTFWLQLDPYPKKPGSDPVTWEISG
jgi:hypothetical protein